MIDITPLTISAHEEGDLDEVIARNAYVHLEMEDMTSAYLIIQDAEHHVHLQISHRGRVPLQVREVESFTRANHPDLWPEPTAYDEMLRAMENGETRRLVL